MIETKAVAKWHWPRFKVGGSEAVLLSAALAGLVSTGSAAVALASLVVAGQ